MLVAPDPRRHEWRWDETGKGYARRPYDDDLQQRLEAAFDDHNVKAMRVDFSFGPHNYKIYWRENDGELPGWVQERTDDPSLWRAVERVFLRISKPKRAAPILTPAAPASSSAAASSSLASVAVPPGSAISAPSYAVGGLSAFEAVSIKTDSTDIGALEGFGHLPASALPAELLESCIDALVADDGLRGSRSQGRAQWLQEPAHNQMFTYTCVAQGPEHDFNVERLRRIGALYGSEYFFADMPKAWCSIVKHLRQQLVLTLDDGSGSHTTLPLLDNMLLSQVQATKMEPGGEIHKHVDKPLFGELIVTVLLQGTSALKLWDEKGSTVLLEQELQPGSTYCLWGMARAVWKHAICFPSAGDDARFSLTYRFVPSSSYQICHTPTVDHPPLEPGMTVESYFYGNEDRPMDRHPATYPALVLAGPALLDQLHGMGADAAEVWPALDDLAGELKLGQVIVEGGTAQKVSCAPAGSMCLLLYLRSGFQHMASPAFRESMAYAIPIAGTQPMREEHALLQYMRCERFLLQGDGELTSGGYNLGAVQRVVYQWANNLQQAIDNSRAVAAGGSTALVPASAQQEAESPGPAAAIAVGQIVTMSGIVQRQELNGRKAKVISRHTTDNGRWNVKVDGELLSIREQKLSVAIEDGAIGEAAAAPVSDGAIVAAAAAASADGAILEEAAAAVSEPAALWLESVAEEVVPGWYSASRFAELLALEGMRPNAINDRIYRKEDTELTAYAFPDIGFEQWKELEKLELYGICAQAENSDSELNRHFRLVTAGNGVGSKSNGLAREFEKRPRISRTKRKRA